MAARPGGLPWVIDLPAERQALLTERASDIKVGLDKRDHAQHVEAHSQLAPIIEASLQIECFLYRCWRLVQWRHHRTNSRRAAGKCKRLLPLPVTALYRRSCIVPAPVRVGAERSSPRCSSTQPPPGPEPVWPGWPVRALGRTPDAAGRLVTRRNHLAAQPADADTAIRPAVGDNLL